MPRKRSDSPVAPVHVLEARPIPPGLEPRQARALELLLGGLGMADCAKACGVTLPVMFEWRYSLPFQEEYSKRVADMRSYVHATVVGRAVQYVDWLHEIAGDSDHRDRLKALAYLMDYAREQQSVYTSAAEWQAAREHARKSAYAELWTLPDAEIVDTVRKLKSLPSGDK